MTDKDARQAGFADRLVAVDAWRFLAVVGIVWLHSGADGSLPRSGNLGRFAVTFFSAAAMYLLFQSVRRNPRRSFIDFARRRFRRIYLPFLGWSVIYLLATNLKRHFISHQTPIRPGWSFFVAGTSLQLWFLPFILMATLAMFPVCRLVVNLGSVGKRSAALILVLTALGICFLPTPWPGPAALGDDVAATRYAVQMSWGTLPALLCGLAMGMIDVRTSMTGLTILAWPVFAIVMAAIFFGGRNIGLENLAGILALAAAMGPWKGKLTLWAANAGKDSYGIYLSHVLFLEAFFAIASARKLANSLPLKVMEFTAALTLSYALVRILKRWPGTRWLTGEE